MACAVCGDNCEFLAQSLAFVDLPAYLNQLTDLQHTGSAPEKQNLSNRMKVCDNKMAC